MGRAAVVSGGYTAPRTEVEEKLAVIWAEVLGLERVGIHDNFFELGGHSLMATQVIARANSVLDVDLALRRLFETPTIAALAAEISVQRAAVSDRAGTRLAGSRGDSRANPLLLRPAAIVAPGTTGREPDCLQHAVRGAVVGTFGR